MFFCVTHVLRRLQVKYMLLFRENENFGICCHKTRNFHNFFFFACLSSIFSKFSPMHIPERHSAARDMFSLTRITFCDAFWSYWKHFWQTWFQRQYKFHHGDFGQYCFTCGDTYIVAVYKTWNVENERGTYRDILHPSLSSRACCIWTPVFSFRCWVFYKGLLDYELVEFYRLLPCKTAECVPIHRLTIAKVFLFFWCCMLHMQRSVANSGFWFLLGKGFAFKFHSSFEIQQNNLKRTVFDGFV